MWLSRHLILCFEIISFRAPSQNTMEYFIAGNRFALLLLMLVFFFTSASFVIIHLSFSATAAAVDRIIGWYSSVCYCDVALHICCLIRFISIMHLIILQTNAGSWFQLFSHVCILGTKLRRLSCPTVSATWLKYLLPSISSSFTLEQGVLRIMYYKHTGSFALPIQCDLDIYWNRNIHETLGFDLSIWFLPSLGFPLVWVFLYFFILQLVSRNVRVIYKLPHIAVGTNSL